MWHHITQGALGLLLSNKLNACTSHTLQGQIKHLSGGDAFCYARPVASLTLASLLANLRLSGVNYRKMALYVLNGPFQNLGLPASLLLVHLF